MKDTIKEELNYIRDCASRYVAKQLAVSEEAADKVKQLISDALSPNMSIARFTKELEEKISEAEATLGGGLSAPHRAALLRVIAERREIIRKLKKIHSQAIDDGYNIGFVDGQRYLNKSQCRCGRLLRRQ